MEAIIMNEGASDGEIINFPKLKSLTIKWMPRLTSFYAEKENMHSGSTSPVDNSAQYHPFFDGKVAFPSLGKLYIWCLDTTSAIWGKDCFISDLKHLKEMEVITDDGILFPQLTVLKLDELPSLTSFWCYQSGKASICKFPLRLPQLSSVVLKDLHDLKSFFHGANFELRMPALKEVKVDSCGLSILFTFSMFRKFQLENLEVQNCPFLENIVEDLKGDETCDKIITLSQLTEVTLENLPHLKSFFHNANFEFHMPVIKKLTVFRCGLSNALFTRSVLKNLKQLEVLHVVFCELLEGIFEDARGDETPDTSDKIITLNRVSKVHLLHLPKFKSFFYGATYECHMPALRVLNIVGCGFTTLFTYSVFREIRQLKELHVHDCESLEHIGGGWG